MPPSELVIRQGRVHVKIKQLERKLAKHRMLTEKEFDEICQDMIETVEELKKLRSEAHR